MKTSTLCSIIYERCLPLTVMYGPQHTAGMFTDSGSFESMGPCNVGSLLDLGSSQPLTTTSTEP